MMFSSFELIITAIAGGALLKSSISLINELRNNIRISKKSKNETDKIKLQISDKDGNVDKYEFNPKDIESIREFLAAYKEGKK
jgi:hypothetical protein